MAYIGVPPVTGDFVVLDNITTSATASYTLQRNSANFSPESANHMLVSLNGTIQKPNSSFTISGSTITFSSALTSSDVIDFILVLGNVNAVGVATTVSDSAITKAKTNFVSSGSGYTGTGLDIKGNGSANGRLGLLCSAGTHGVALESPDHSSAQSYTIQLPSNSPTANKFIKVTSLTGSGATAIAHTQFAEAGGSHTLIQSTNITSNVIEVDFDNTIDDTYTNYMVVGRGIKKDTQNAIRFQYKNGSSALTSTYDWAYGHGARTRSSSAWFNKDSGTAYLQMQEDCGTQTTSFTSFIDSSGRTSGSGYCPFYGTITNWKNNTAGQQVATHTGVYVGSTTINGFKIFCQSGNFTAGRISLYGVSHG